MNAEQKQELVRQLKNSIDDLTSYLAIKPEPKDAYGVRWTVKVQEIALESLTAPAVNLVDLVPDEWTLAQALEFVDEYAPPSEEEAALFAANAYRAAILRKIEEVNGQTIPASKVGSVADTEVQAGSGASGEEKSK